MVTFQQLSTAQPALWSDAAADWSKLSQGLGKAAADLNTQTRRVLSSGNWGGQVYNTALSRITMAITVPEAAEAEVSAVAAVLTGLAEATTIAQSMLDEARRLAANNRMQIGTDGAVTAAPGPPALQGAATTQPPGVLPGDPSQVQAVGQLISQALQHATAADKLAAAELAKLAQHTRVADPKQAYDGDVGDATRTELATIIAAIPTGPPSLVAAWWAGLSPAEQEKLKLAVPTTLAALPGIPDAVKGELHGSDGIDRMKLVEYALKNWNNNADNHWKDNCTNFVSDALAAAGLQQQGTFPWGKHDVTDNWYRAPAPPFLASYSASWSWTEASGLHSFLTHNNSTEIPLSEAKPGDIIFWQDPSQGIHHAAVVTSVVDGHVFFSAHSGNQQNADWNLRGTMYDEQNNPQNAVVVRPRQDGKYLAR